MGAVQITKMEQDDQGIFWTQGLNPGLPHCKQTLYPLSHQGSLSNLATNQNSHSPLFELNHNELNRRNYELLFVLTCKCINTGFPGASEVKASACNAGDPISIPGSGRSPGEGNGNPLQYSCLENPMEGGAW